LKVRRLGGDKAGGRLRQFNDAADVIMTPPLSIKDRKPIWRERNEMTQTRCRRLNEYGTDPDRRIRAWPIRKRVDLL
jgi:hypothetical protein